MEHTLCPLQANVPFGARGVLGVPFKVERSANGKFIAKFVDGSTIAVTEAQLRSEQRFRHRLRLKLGREFAAQSQSSWEYVLACQDIVDWTDRAFAYDRHMEEQLERSWEDFLGMAAGEHYGPEA
jgi:hypothetical protein